MESKSVKLPPISQEIRDKLRKPIASDGIRAHENKPYLTSIKSIYITERLNDVFGIGRWTVIHKVVKDEDGYILMKGRLVLLDYDCRVPWQFGGHRTEGTGTEPADGYKSAVTDIISKSASYLEIGIDVFKGRGGNGKPNKQSQRSGGDNGREDIYGPPQNRGPEEGSQEPRITTPELKELSEMFFGLEPPRQVEVLSASGVLSISNKLTQDEALGIKEHIVSILQEGV